MEGPLGNCTIGKYRRDSDSLCIECPKSCSKLEGLSETQRSACLPYCTSTTIVTSSTEKVSSTVSTALGICIPLVSLIIIAIVILYKYRVQVKKKWNASWIGKKCPCEDRATPNGHDRATPNGHGRANRNDTIVNVTGNAVPTETVAFLPSNGTNNADQANQNNTTENEAVNPVIPVLFSEHVDSVAVSILNNSNASTTAEYICQEDSDNVPGIQLSDLNNKDNQNDIPNYDSVYIESGIKNHVYTSNMNDESCSFANKVIQNDKESDNNDPDGTPITDFIGEKVVAVMEAQANQNNTIDNEEVNEVPTEETALTITEEQGIPLMVKKLNDPKV